MQRSCWSDYMVFFVRDRALTVLILLGGLSLLLLCRSGRWAEARHLLIVVLVGGLLCELLKTGLERPRPSVLSEVAAGNSFPSGHVTTALLVAGALGRLIVARRKFQMEESDWLGSSQCARQLDDRAATLSRSTLVDRYRGQRSRCWRMAVLDVASLASFRSHQTVHWVVWVPVDDLLLCLLVPYSSPCPSFRAHAEWRASVCRVLWGKEISRCPSGRVG